MPIHDVHVALLFTKVSVQLRVYHGMASCVFVVMNVLASFKFTSVIS